MKNILYIVLVMSVCILSCRVAERPEDRKTVEGLFPRGNIVSQTIYVNDAYYNVKDEDGIIYEVVVGTPGNNLKIHQLTYKK